MQRVDLKCGFLCNNNCLFCVQAHKKSVGNKPLAELKADLDEARKICSEVVFTGGEVTIRPDLVELVRYAKDIGYRTIQIQTNARMLAYKDLCRKLIDAGANEFSPALHGHIPQLHDYLTSAPGSFEQTIKAIKNLKSLNQKVITNTVIVKSNYRHCEEIARLLVSLKVDQFQFAFVHPLGNALQNFDSVVPYMSLAVPHIKKGLDVGAASGTACMAEAIPYCFMQGYEKYVSENYIPATTIYDIDGVIDDYKKTRLAEGKVKFPQCKQCRFDKICEGPWKEYPERMGNKEFVAQR